MLGTCNFFFIWNIFTIWNTILRIYKIGSASGALKNETLALGLLGCDFKLIYPGT
jgi:hypothetical protein